MCSVNCNYLLYKKLQLPVRPSIFFFSPGSTDLQLPLKERVIFLTSLNSFFTMDTLCQVLLFYGCFRERSQQYEKLINKRTDRSKLYLYSIIVHHSQVPVFQNAFGKSKIIHIRGLKLLLNHTPSTNGKPLPL